MGLGERGQGGLGASGNGEVKQPSGLSVAGPESLGPLQQYFKETCKNFSPVPERSAIGRKFGLIVFGTKDGGKSTDLATLPRPNNGKTVFISFDGVTWEGLVQAYGEAKLAEMQVEVWDVTKPIHKKDENGEIVKDAKGQPIVVYPGYDATKPQTAKAVIGYTIWILDKYLKEAIIVDNVILDFWEGAHSKIGVDYCRALANIPAGEKVSIYKYAPRSGALNMIMALAIKLAKHCYAVTGYEKEFTLGEEETELSDGRKKTEVVKKLQDARWIEKYQEPFSVRVRATSSVQTIDGVKQRRFHMEPITAKNVIFEEGEDLDVTNVGVKAFWDRYEEKQKLAAAVVA